MSAETNAQNIPSKKSSNAAVFTSSNAKKTGLNHQENSTTPPELKLNEAAARPKPIQVSEDKHDDNHEGNSAEDEEDACKKKNVFKTVDEKKFRVTPGLDPRFQQQNQTLRCFVMYTDFYRCEKILGEGHNACTWFHDVFTSICPNAWIERWDQWRSEGRMPWSRSRTQGNFPGDRYGV